MLRKPLLVILLIGASLTAERFEFKYVEGGKYRLLTQVREDVYIQRRYSHSAYILNRIAYEVKEAREGSGLIEASFETSEEASGSGQAFKLDQRYESRFRRDRLGTYDIDPSYYMPIVRDVPLFPDKDLKKGDTWTMKGEEVHDFRRNFGIAEPYRIPFVASYRYEGVERREGKDYPVITVSYSIYYEASTPRGAARVWPVSVMGYSDQKILWDMAVGQPAFYEERFKMIFELSDGGVVEFRGTADGKMLEAPPMDKEVVAKELEKELGEGSKVRIDKEGVTLVLDAIQFLPDSAELRPGELSKLDKIIDALAKYPERDLLVTGHTALQDTEEWRLRLSELRAKAVADYIASKGARDPGRITLKGMGATKPVADNATIEGRALNRRGEITILEN